jgi:hypothetical protein
MNNQIYEMIALILLYRTYEYSYYRQGQRKYSYYRQGQRGTIIMFYINTILYIDMIDCHKRFIKNRITSLPG